MLAAMAALLVSTTFAAAHPGAGVGHDLTHGFLHPLGGLDHVRAMIAVGLLAAQLGGRAFWLVPGAFVGTMTIAAVASWGMTPAPHVELGIAASVLMIGATVFLQLGLPVSLAAAIAGVFAIFHGVAHGAEIPSTMSGIGYGLGFVAATVLLHAAGIGVGLLAQRLVNPMGAYAVRAVGACIAAVGVMMVIASALV
jgi:urease accessory protein